MTPTAITRAPQPDFDDDTTAAYGRFSFGSEE